MIERPYLIFLGDVPDALAAKTAYGIVDWRRDWCLGQLRLPGCKADTGLADMSIGEAAAAGARTFIIGAVNPGGRLPEHWVETVVEAIEAGMDVASGLHVRLASFTAIREAAERKGAKLHDARHANQTFSPGTGSKRPGKRLLTVGTDCSVGKKYAALAIDRELSQRGVASQFCATGQTGVMIAGRGIAIDAVVADFISGAAEWLSPATDPANWQIVEGQGSLFHPSFAGVSLGLLHGAQPDAFVICHEPTRKTMRNVEAPIASIDAVIEQTQRLGSLTNPAIRPAGICINTSALEAAAAEDCLAETAERYGLPACDPIRTGVAPIVDHLLAEFR
ncbi:N-acetyltransferase DgcN [Afifella pfennigii]|uniref:N-acetyltransferase DgcN n=1 Tax=Afifella pfennigii TaxID=209897 RepID=UPI00047B6BEB|nr:N-acetyltransferase DgcN [Afifella pfennigii]